MKKVDRGRYCSRMTARCTQDEWLSIISEAEKNLPLTRNVYKAAKPGTEAFSKSIDHTLLKLDATKEQIEALCEEAMKYNFKVSLELLSHSLLPA